MALFDSSNSQLYCLAAGGLFLLAIAASRFFRSSLKDIRGPPRSSFLLGSLFPILCTIGHLETHALLGNQGDFRYQAEVGDVEFPWLNEFGGAWKVYGPLGVRLLTRV